MKDDDVRLFSEYFMLLIPLMQNKVFSFRKEELPAIRLSESARRTLALLHEIRCAIVSDLSDELNISRPNMTPLLDKLAEQGLVSRLPCGVDRRQIYVQITAKGDELCREYQQLITSKIKEMIDHLDEEELREMIEHMKRLKSILIKTGESSL
ncbi:MarR family winged helix-turn-helix transcriptional regulator [Paenibacillus senegalensis]|uniref:MarR family winged helix-turn-helix transcriptional regulator n=1 Tax=Paenibacillus senegalensis TaxID=1465766 RepID=UPI000287F5BD|nr:MarR family transcriptional regulator [Paenibacillus senegalensis]